MGNTKKENKLYILQLFFRLIKKDTQQKLSVKWDKVAYLEIIQEHRGFMRNIMGKKQVGLIIEKQKNGFYILIAIPLPLPNIITLKDLMPYM